MKKATRTIALLACVSLSLTGCASSKSDKDAGGKLRTASAGIQLASGFKSIQQLQGNLYGSQTAEQIVLAEKESSQQPLKSWQVWVDQKKVLELDSCQSFYSVANIALDNVDGDAYQELLVYRISSGSGAGLGLNLYKLRDGQEPLMMLVTDPGFEDQADFCVKYIGAYQIVFKSQSIGFDATIHLNPDNYKDMENELQKIDTWVDPIAQYEITDLDNDGKKEVIGIRRIIGICHPDTIARLKISYKLNGDAYEPSLYTLTDAEGKTIAEKAAPDSCIADK